MIGILLYACLGFALAASGVGVMEKPWQFIVIMMLVIAIDLTAKFKL
jgi:hypothetical protein